MKSSDVRNSARKFAVLSVGFGFRGLGFRVLWTSGFFGRFWRVLRGLQQVLIRVLSDFWIFQVSRVAAVAEVCLFERH